MKIMSQTDPCSRTALYLMRHPPLRSGARNTCVGQTDVDLAPTVVNGWSRWCQAAGDVLPERVISSDLRRCRAFASEIGRRLNIPVETDQDWRELFFGVWEGRKWDEIYRSDPTFFQRWAMHFVGERPPGGESFEALQERVAAAMGRAVETDLRRILVVTHAGPIRAAVALIQGTPLRRSFEWEVSFGGCIDCQWDGRQWSVLEPEVAEEPEVS